MEAGYTIIDFMIADKLLVPIIGVERDFNYDASPDWMFTNVWLNAARRSMLPQSSQIILGGSEIKSQCSFPDKVMDLLSDSLYYLSQSKGDPAQIAHLVDVEGSREEIIYANHERSSVVLHIGAGGYPGKVQYHLSEPDELPRTLYRIVDGWGSAWDSEAQPERWGGNEGYTTSFHISSDAFDGTTHKHEPFTNIFGLVKLIQDVTSISSVKSLGSGSQTENR